MNRLQHDTERQLQAAERDWLQARHWRAEGSRWQHENAPPLKAGGYTQRDAIALTRSEPLKYGATR